MINNINLELDEYGTIFNTIENAKKLAMLITVNIPVMFNFSTEYSQFTVMMSRINLGFKEDLGNNHGFNSQSDRLFISIVDYSSFCFDLQNIAIKLKDIKKNLEAGSLEYHNSIDYQIKVGYVCEKIGAFNIIKTSDIEVIEFIVLAFVAYQLDINKK